MKPLYGYICGTDTLEVSLGATDVKIFPSVKELNSGHSCWKECGILKIPLHNLKYQVKPKKK